MLRKQSNALSLRFSDVPHSSTVLIWVSFQKLQHCVTTTFCFYSWQYISNTDRDGDQFCRKETALKQMEWYY